MNTNTQKIEPKYAYRFALPALIVAILFVSSVCRAEISMSTLDTRLVRSAESFENVLNSKTGPMPRSILEKAQGIVIFREYGAGFIWGGKGGFGIAMERQPNGQWGPPAFLGQGEGNFGLQIGVQRQDLVFLFMSREALKIFDHEKFKIGVDVAAAAGPVGANAEAQAGAPVLVYSDTTGLYAGATFKGGMLLPDKDANEKYYGRQGIRVPEILRGENVSFPAAAGELRQDLEDYESGHHRD